MNQDLYSFSSLLCCSHQLASTFVDSWRVLELDKSKTKCFARKASLTSDECETSIEEKANLVCTDLLKNPKMKNCLTRYREDILLKNCISDFCFCKNKLDPTECICNGITALVRDCRSHGIKPPHDGWRDWQICRKSNVVVHFYLISAYHVRIFGEKAKRGTELKSLKYFIKFSENFLT